MRCKAKQVVETKLVTETVGVKIHKINNERNVKRRKK